VASIEPGRETSFGGSEAARVKSKCDLWAGFGLSAVKPAFDGSDRVLDVSDCGCRITFRTISLGYFFFLIQTVEGVTRLLGFCLPPVVTETSLVLRSFTENPSSPTVQTAKRGSVISLPQLLQ
jgi:hypothetical protein